MELPVAEPSRPEGDMKVTHKADLLKNSSSSVIEWALAHPTKPPVQEVSMEQRLYYLSPLKKKMTYFFVKWEEIFTLATVLCALSAIGSGILWLFLKKATLLYMLVGFSSGYFVGKNFWKFRHELV